MKKSMLIPMFLISSIIVKAQFTETYRAQMVKDWERAKAYTNAYIAVIPVDKYSFRANDSIRTIAQQLLHLAGGNFGLGSQAVGVASPLPQRNLEAAPGAQSKDSVVYFVNASYDFVIENLKKMPLSALEEKGKFFRFEEPRWIWINKTFEHQTHHRGQLTTYIRVLGIKPPQEMLF
jgi:hypothetical protein